MAALRTDDGDDGPEPTIDIPTPPRKAAPVKIEGARASSRPQARPSRAEAAAAAASAGLARRKAFLDGKKVHFLPEEMPLGDWHLVRR